ncbi:MULTISPECIES: cytochrome P450 [Nitrosomonas]|uniref:Cytochrome P450 n=2 Tax=Nitrosomonas communis TaxID=44574 RepID=A0A5D3Y8W1_9PROT|nr:MULTISPECIES: cytochrome P450 [Nitrosomonas]TYP78328.1 cytochrome P450 [Nitrosomonas communis]UVS60287.1 cytochrome P450 [Nitrosomonas sp. PLL12]
MAHNKTVPQVKGDFLLGNLRQMIANPLQAFYGWQQNYGDLVSFRLAARQFYLFSHPKLVEQALIRQSDVFVKTYNPEKPTGLALILGQGLVTSQGDLWQRQRRLMQPVFQRSNVTTLLPQMATAGNNMLARWRQLGEGAQVNLSGEMMRLTLEVITQTMFSTSVLDKIEQIAPSLEILLRYAAKTIANPLTLPLYVPTPANRKFKQALEIIDNVIYGMIDQRRTAPSGQNDLLDMLLKARDDNNGEKMTDRQVRDEVITIFSAGHETTANLLSWTLYLLVRHPGALARLREELDRLLQGKIPNAADLQQLVYTRAVLSESMRLRPPASFLLRKVSKDTEVDDYFLKAGRLAIFSIFNLHHHADFWPQPEQFDPERFLVSQNRRYSFIPFGTGERICIGSHFALMESQLLLCMIIQHCDLQLLDPDEVEIEMAITLRPKGGIPACINWR